MNLRYTKHARKRMNQRDLSDSQVERVVEAPEFTEEQEDGCIRYYGWVKELNFVLRVVCRGDLVVTALPDRTAKRRLK